MMRRRNIVLLLLALTCCIEPYEPPLAKQDAEFLTVDGFVNLTTNSATIKLTNSVTLGSTEPPSPVVFAQVWIESDKGNVWPLGGKTLGVYSTSGLDVPNDVTLTLKIKTQAGREYSSDPVTPQRIPEIESITWKPKEDAISLYVTTSDPEKGTNYYLWDFDETWEYQTAYYSFYEFNNYSPTPRYEVDQVFRCWKTVPSTGIHVSSSEGLQQNIVSEYPLFTIKKGDQRLFRKYSILVKQKGIDKDEYEFWQQLKRTTENLGGLFDPLPSQVIGNMNSNDGSPVLGYFSASEVKERRIFISFDDLPENLQAWPNFTQCDLFNIPLWELSRYTPSQMLVNGYGSPDLQGYTSAASMCVDCTLQGGATKPPAFWQP